MSTVKSQDSFESAVPRILILNHHGPSVPSLIERVRESGASFSVLEHGEVRAGSARGFDGIIASGGSLPARSYRDDLQRYFEFLDELERPFLGICLGMKILGSYHEARMRRILPVEGAHKIRFFREYLLAPGVAECSVYGSHRYELIPPLPPELENYASDGSPIQAVKVVGRERYALQFHPELSEVPARSIVANFVSRC